MITNIALTSELNNLSGKTSFNGEKPVETSAADNFVSGVNAMKDAQNNKFSISNILWSATAIYPTSVGLLGYTLHSIYKLKKLEKTGDKEALDACRKNLPRKFLWSLAVAGLAIAGLQKLFSLNFDSKFEDTKAYFDKVNTTNAKLNENTFKSGYTGAFFSPISGDVHLNKNIISDPWNNYKNRLLIKHELVHAKQYETIARMPDGIKKLNYSVVKRIAKPFDTPELRPEFMQIYNEVANDKTGKYDNVVLKLPEADVDFKSYITAISTVLTKPDATYEDIPIIINQEHYQNVIKKEGQLKPEELEKAQAYYQAALDYPIPTVWKMINPFSSYYNNLLEKEAYKENPWYTRII